MQQIDQSVFFFLNGLHNQFFDVFFWYATDKVYYLPLYIIAAWLAYKQFGKKIWILLLFVILTVLLTDQICDFLKNTIICRLRPTRNSDIASLVHIVNGYRGEIYGFPSAHACNTFGITVFLYRIIRPKRWGFTLAFFAWAIIMSYSRMYLGVHYPADILCGATLGALIGWGMSAVFRASRFTSHPISSKPNPSRRRMG